MTRPKPDKTRTKSTRAEEAIPEAPFDAASAAASIAKVEAAAAKAGITLPAGASEQAIAAAEARLGVTFPASMRAYYLAHDGGPEDEVCGGRMLLSLEHVVSQWEIWKGLFDAGDLEDDGVEPDTGVRAKWWIPEWIPVTHDFGGNHDMVDLAPAKRGKRGQVLSFWHDDGSRTVEGDDFLGWLEDQKWGETGDDDEDDEASGPYTLSEPSPWRPGPLAYVFQLGKNAKGGKTRVPTQYTTSPCYFYRADKKSFGAALNAIPEPDVADDDVDVTFAAIDGYVAENDLRRELYTDAEIEAGGAHSETRGFHAGASYEETKAALVRGGFNVIDRLAPRGLGPEMDDLAHHLHFTSLELVLRGFREEVSFLPHADAASGILEGAIGAGRGALFVDTIARVAPSWTGEMRQLAALLGSAGWLRHRKYRCGDPESELGMATLALLRRLLEGLGPVTDAESRRRLEAWGLGAEAASVALPDRLPRDVDGALALVRGTGLAPLVGKPLKASSDAKLPDALLEVYARTGRFGKRALLPPKQHAELHEELVSGLRAASESGEEREPGDLAPALLSAPKKLVAFGKDTGGDVFFLDPGFVVDGTLPVLRFVHDEGPTVRVEASSLASFIAGKGLDSAHGLGLFGPRVDALVEQDRALVSRPTAPVGAGKKAGKKRAR